MEIKKVTITKVYKSDKNKDGIAYVYKNGANAGKNFFRVGIRTEQTGDNTYYANAMVGDRVYAIEEGQTLILRFEEKDGFKNFGFPSKKQLEELL